MGFFDLFRRKPKEFHEQFPPDWVPPFLIRDWDAADPELRRVMKEEIDKINGVEVDKWEEIDD